MGARQALVARDREGEVFCLLGWGRKFAKETAPELFGP